MGIGGVIKNRLIIFAVIISAALTLAACGSGGDDENSVTFKLNGVYVTSSEANMKNERCDSAIVGSKVYLGFSVTNPNNTVEMNAVLTESVRGDVIETLSGILNQKTATTLFYDEFSEIGWSKPSSGYYTLTVTVSSGGKKETGFCSFRVL